MKETISVTDENGKVYEFEKPEFECELYAIKQNRIVGFATSNMGYGLEWRLDGSIIGRGNSDYLRLTRIKKEWYEDEANFPCWITNGNSILPAKSKNNYLANAKDGWRLATKEEVETLYYKDKQ